jgi:ABC-type lipoprotein release transport system permease subunit
MVLRQGSTLMLAGAMLGVSASLYATRLLESLLVGVQRADPMTYGFVLGVVALSTLLACWIPARRASVTDPAVTLRGE